MTEHTPTDEQMQADWHAYITTPDEENYYYDALSSEEADARWSRWLAAHDARVRRDAAREALDGLIADKAHMAALLHAENGGNVEDVLAHYRDTHYPEGRNMAEQQIDLQEQELDYWMARAYEAEGNLWKAEARVKAVEDVLDAEEARPRPIGGGYDKRAMVRIADIRRALESDPPPGQ